MWIMTVSGLIFIEMERTSQGLLVPKEDKCKCKCTCILDNNKKGFWSNG